MSCFCCPCRFESRKNPHFGVQEGAKYELYINKDGIFRVAHRFGFFVKMPAPGTFLCFASVIFPRRFVVIPCSRVCQRSFLRPPSSVSRFLAPGEPPRRFSPCVVIFRFFAASRVPALAFVVSHAGRAGFLLRCRAGSAPTWAFVVSHAGVPVFCSIVGRVSTPPLGCSLSPAPGVPVFCSVVGRVSSPPLGRSLSPAPGVPVCCSIVGRVSSPTLWRFRPCAADGSPSGNRRARVQPGSGKHTESGGSSFESFRRF